MKTSTPRNISGANQSRHRLARAVVWSILYQDEIAHHVRLYMWSGVALVLLVALSGKISVDTAIHGILIVGLTVCGGLWLLILKRRSWLLKITDPELKETAYAAMVIYLSAKETRPRKTRSGDAPPQKKTGTTLRDRRCASLPRRRPLYSGRPKHCMPRSNAL